MVKTISLTAGAEVKVDILGKFVSVENQSTNAKVYAGCVTPIVAGADGVRMVVAGASKVVPMVSNAIHLMADVDCTVELNSGDSYDQVFNLTTTIKGDSSGGSGVAGKDGKSAYEIYANKSSTDVTFTESGYKINLISDTTEVIDKVVKTFGDLDFAVGVDINCISVTIDDTAVEQFVENNGISVGNYGAYVKLGRTSSGYNIILSVAGALSSSGHGLEFSLDSGAGILLQSGKSNIVIGTGTISEIYYYDRLFTIYKAKAINESDWLDTLKGVNGQGAKSAYQQAVDGGYTNTESAFITSLANIDNVVTIEKGTWIPKLVISRYPSSGGDVEVVTSIDTDYYRDSTYTQIGNLVLLDVNFEFDSSLISLTMEDGYDYTVSIGGLPFVLCGMKVDITSYCDVFVDEENILALCESSDKVSLYRKMLSISGSEINILYDYALERDGLTTGCGNLNLLNLLLKGGSSNCISVYDTTVVAKIYE